MIISENNVQDMGMGTDIATDIDIYTGMDTFTDTLHGQLQWTTSVDNLQTYKSV
jgi:hypothetical protein